MVKEDPKQIVRVEEFNHPIVPDVQIYYSEGNSERIVNDELVGLGLRFNEGEKAKTIQVQKIKDLIGVIEGLIPGALRRALSGWPKGQQKWIKEAMEFNDISFPDESSD